MALVALVALVAPAAAAQPPAGQPATLRARVDHDGRPVNAATVRSGAVAAQTDSLGGAGVRLQGLRGRYTRILSDGLPLRGGQSGALGLLRIPPMDLGQVEIVKGAASALYGASAPDGRPFAEALDTRRGDVGRSARLPVGQHLLGLRGSFTGMRHEHRFGEARERDRHDSWLAEASYVVPCERLTWIVGAAAQGERYRSRDVPRFDCHHAVPALFAQADAEPAPWLARSGSARLDAHSEHGTFVNPRLSALLRAPAERRLAGWTLRGSVGTGTFAPHAQRRATALEPRHALGIVGMHEREGEGRVGVELYYTGRQPLPENPYRTTSRPYVVAGALVGQRVGRARLFVNFENLTDVRQTRWDPLLRPVRGPGGRWTTDAWADLAGRTVNGGVRLDL